MKNPWFVTTGRHVAVLITLSTILLSFGTAGYMVIAGFSFLDAIYMTVITLTTVGFGEINPLGPAGRAFTMLLIFLGAGFVAYNLAYFSQLLLDGNLLEAYRRFRLDTQMEKLSNHYIICGYGQMGQIITRELNRAQVPVIVIDREPVPVHKFSGAEVFFLSGDATEEENLISAGATRAKGLVTVVTKDTDNVFIVLTARDLNKDLHILARAGSPGTEKRLLKAGANRVVSPYASGATRIVHNILRPTVTDLLELAFSEGIELSMEELCIPDGASLVGKELIHSGIRSRYNLIVVAIRRRDGRMVYNPSPHETLEAGDILVVIGPQENLARFGAELFGCPYPTLKSCKQ